MSGSISKGPSEWPRPLLTGGALIAAWGALLWAAPGVPPHRTGSELGNWLTSTPPDQVLTVLAGLSGWLCLCWLASAALFAALGELPGFLGVLCRRIADRITPAILRRAIEGLLGTALASGAVAAALPADAATPTHSAAVQAVGTAALRWAPHAQGQPVSAMPDGWPDVDRPHSSSSESRQPPGPHKSRTAAAPAVASAGAAVTVRGGDTLWAIARRGLGGFPTQAEVATAWPRWYAANRAVIGPNPDVLQPGDVLRDPAGPPRP
ncbi:MAG: hypothetical protein ABJC62_08135 [Frankiaceae bacterium]